MRAIKLLGASLEVSDIAGRVLSHDLAAELRKGRILQASDLDRLRLAREVHVVEMAEGDVHEDDAALRLGTALCGANLRLKGPTQSQVRLLSEVRGLLSVDADAVLRLNTLPALSVFTLMDGQAVDAGEEVAGCKVTPVAVPAEVLADAEAICTTARVLQVAPFRALRTLVVVTEKLSGRAREIFARALTRKLGWYGAELLDVREVTRDAEAVRRSYEEAVRREAELVLFAGASTIDPLDPAYGELSAAGGRLVRAGAPAHPGSMLWMGRLNQATVLGIASCAGFGRSTSLDLVLPYVFARGWGEADDLVRLGHGGLVEKAAGRRFPGYPG